ncbi:MAG: NTP transferase domain-containing protein [Gammaproteobacteria bacterium]|nr:NTP transferase domain-containing protein [Gammaproteobacteria bacterium]
MAGATRMSGADKGLIEVAGRPMVAYVLEALAPQVERILINANRNQDRYAAFGYPVVADEEPTSRPHCGTRQRVADVPDAPDAGRSLRLSACRSSSRRAPAEALEPEGTEIAVAFDGESLQPVFLLLRRRLYRSLEAFLACGGRKVGDWLEQHQVAKADLSDCRDTFINVNDPADREALEARLFARPTAGRP